MIPRKDSKGRWVAAGFIGAFTLSIFTVIYTGLNVEGSVAEFDAGFRSLTVAVGDDVPIELVFESPRRYSAATLDLTLPPMLELPAGEPTVDVVGGENRYTVTLRAVEAGSGYVVGRLAAREPIGLYRVFVTVE